MCLFYRQDIWMVIIIISARRTQQNPISMTSYRWIDRVTTRTTTPVSERGVLILLNVDR